MNRFSKAAITGARKSVHPSWVKGRRVILPSIERKKEASLSQKDIAALTIQRAWLSHMDKRVFYLLKHTIFAAGKGYATAQETKLVMRWITEDERATLTCVCHNYSRVGVRLDTSQEMRATLKATFGPRVIPQFLPIINANCKLDEGRSTVPFSPLCSQHPVHCLQHSRLRGETFPPFIVCKIFIPTGGQAYKYFSGKNMLK